MAFLFHPKQIKKIELLGEDLGSVARMRARTFFVLLDDGIAKTYTEGTNILDAIGTYRRGLNSGKIPVSFPIVNFWSSDLVNTVKRQ